MSEQKSGGKPVEAASAAPGERRAASRPLAKAAESGHPDVHKALADLQTARQNLAAVQDAHDTEDAEAEQAEKDALDRLRELGYEE
jgi:hypothetical protein